MILYQRWLFLKKVACPLFLYATVDSPVAFVGAMLFQLPCMDIIHVFRGRAEISFFCCSSYAKNMSARLIKQQLTTVAYEI